MISVSTYIKYFIIIIFFTIIYFFSKLTWLQYQPIHTNALIRMKTSKTKNQLYYINNKLFMTNKNFSLPLNNDKIFQNVPREIFPINNVENMDNRIYNQMLYVPEYYTQNEINITEKLILLYNGTQYMQFGNFKECPVSKCRFSSDLKTVNVADVILWIKHISPPNHKRPNNQIWALLFHESPMHTPNVKLFEQISHSMINWTVTYRPDSTIPSPYSKYTPYDMVHHPPKKYSLPKQNFALGKNKLVAWFVSNCNPSNDRNAVVRHFQKFMQVDIFGKCGTLSCPRENEKSCFKMLNENYKFYLSFENSYCRQYITEKFFLNGLSHNVIPIVLGAHPDDYKQASPPHSYIHVEDFNNISDLADYIKYLDRNDTAYNEYFAWKPYGTTRFNDYLHCRLCLMAHEADRVKTFIPNIHKWWHGENSEMCFKTGRWINHTSTV